MPSELLKQYTQAQAVYMTYLRSKAKALLAAPDALLPDPFGRSLVDVRLTAEDYDTLLTKIAPTELLDGESSKDAMQRALGIKPTDTITVCLDGLTSLKDPIKELDIPKHYEVGSIIGLQQELYFHLALVQRVYQELIPTGSDIDDDKALYLRVHQETMRFVNECVMEAYQSASLSARTDPSKLNISFDIDRTILAQKANNYMLWLFSKEGVTFDKDILKAAKDIAEKKTATSNDVMYFSEAQGVATWIEGSDFTAHERIKGADFAHRQLISHPYDGAVVTAHPTPRIQIRTPSLALKKGLSGEKEYISDVVIKLQGVKKHYALAETLSSEESMPARPKAFVYNLFTAINDFFGDRRGNLQTQSARHILQGAHDYNLAQLKIPNPAERVFCFVQNISVNGYGDALGYRKPGLFNLWGRFDGFKTRQEATVMTEMSLLHTVSGEDVSPDQKRRMGHVFDLYQRFLTHHPRLAYFYNSPEGQEAIAVIDTIKREGISCDMPNVSDTRALARQSLQQLMTLDAHMTHEFSKLVQTLSVFVEEGSLGGCKSGNERAQAINGRVAMLDSSPLSEDIKTAFHVFLSASPEKKLEQARVLKGVIDTAYNQRGLQTAASVVSLLDQGGPAKVEAKDSRSFRKSHNRNCAEEDVSVMTCLHQSNASKMQAHKGFSDLLKKAWTALKNTRTPQRIPKLNPSISQMGVRSSSVVLIMEHMSRSGPLRTSTVSTSISTPTPDASLDQERPSPTITMPVDPKKIIQDEDEGEGEHPSFD